MPQKAKKAAEGRTGRGRRDDIESAGVEQDVVVRAMRLGDALASQMDMFLRRYGLTTLQYNVLRILYVRDAEREGLPSGSFAARLVRRVPDVPRLLDRLVKAGLLERVRSEEDRRVVRVRLTDEGLDLVERINDPLFAYDRRLLEDVPKAALKRMAGDLQRLLDSVLAHGADNDGDAG